MSVRIVIGKNFGDEGKGLATDYFAALAQNAGQSCLVIRHNGGGQAGHTVDLPDKRFVFHQLSSGSFRGADTYWEKTFLPDLYKLREETDAFLETHGSLPRIYGHPMCRCVYIDDILVNMALETMRGSDRHGSCGMGINEAVERSAEPGYALYLEQLCKMEHPALYERLSQIRKHYLPKRLAQLGLKPADLGEYGVLLDDETVLWNAAEQMCRATGLITITRESVACDYQNVVFEGAQGLLLDEDYLLYAPHLTSSKTGAQNPMAFVREYLPGVIPELVYVTRSYVTRHGAGPLPYEQEWDPSAYSVEDKTNRPNCWQGSLRLAPHGNREDFWHPVLADVGGDTEKYKLTCMVTHLNETNGAIRSVLGEVPINLWFADLPRPPERLYLSSSPFCRDVCVVETE